MTCASHTHTLYDLMSLSGTWQIRENGYGVKHNGAEDSVQIGEKVLTPAATPPTTHFANLLKRLPASFPWGQKRWEEFGNGRRQGLAK